MGPLPAEIVAGAAPLAAALEPPLVVEDGALVESDVVPLVGALVGALVGEPVGALVAALVVAAVVVSVVVSLCASFFMTNIRSQNVNERLLPLPLIKIAKLFKSKLIFQYSHRHRLQKKIRL